VQSVGSFLPWDLANEPGEEELLERDVAVLSADLAGFSRAKELLEALERQIGPLRGALVKGFARLTGLSLSLTPWRQERRS